MTMIVLAAVVLSIVGGIMPGLTSRKVPVRAKVRLTGRFNYGGK